MYPLLFFMLPARKDTKGGREGEGAVRFQPECGAMAHTYESMHAHTLHMTDPRKHAQTHTHTELGMKTQTSQNPEQIFLLT